MNWLRQLRPCLVSYQRWEHLLIRLLCAWVIYDAIPWSLKPGWAAMPNPNGIATVIPFGWLAHPGVMDWIRPVVIGGLACWAVGFVPLLALFPALFTILGAGAVWASQREGAAQHSVQLIAMLVLAQWLFLLWDTFRHKRLRLRFDQWSEDRFVHVSKWVIAVTYVACAFMKLKRNGIFWFQKGPAMAVQTIKTNLQGYYSESDIELNQWLLDTAPKYFTDHPVLSGLFFGVGLLLELFAFLTLVGRRWALAVGGGLLVMHLMIFWLTTIKFTSHIHAVSVFFVLPGLWWWGREAKKTPASL
ncbi:MAG: hypothetical protein KA004_05565 [Verrucomicrobiales bacterium]|nr:hypothetical protein [Verrucomicrobiales bacterium]